MYWIIGGVLLACILYSLIFFIPKQVQFSYAGETCVRHLLIAPNIQSVRSDEFTVTPRDEVKIGPVTLASTRLCFEPVRTPASGVHVASIAPYGGVIAAKQLRVIVPEAPQAQVAEFDNTLISTVRPLEIPLSAADKIHTYTFTVKNKEAVCQTNDAQVLCDVAALELEQGTTYPVELTRSLNGASEEIIAEGTVETLSPLAIVETSIADAQVVYIKPKELTITADRKIDRIEATLIRRDGETSQEIKVETEVSDEMATIRFTADLPRNSKYELLLKQVLGKDGSSLAEPQTLRFSTSGGPAVKSISIGAHSVDRNARITITLDQPLADSVAIADFARTAGVNATFTKAASDQLIVTFHNAPECAAFTVTLDKGMQSGVNDELSAAWSHTSRTLCGTSSVIGYSVRGRPIIAYYFGSGAETILFTGGIHGSERSGQQTMQAWVDYLRAYGDIVPANRKVVVVPNTNPDAIAANMRYNVNNVNIDRNFPASNWQADIETSQGLIINGGGTVPASEPETKALLNLTRQLRPRLAISYHAQGRLVGANQVSISVQAGNVYAQTVGYRTMYGIAEEVMGYPITGEYEDWMGEELGSAAILIELPTPSGNYLTSQLAAIKKMLYQ